jgi:hypothetical protein
MASKRKLSITTTMTRMVQVPMPINFVQIDGASVDIGHLDEATVQAIGKAWAEQLNDHARERRMRLAKDRK